MKLMNRIFSTLLLCLAAMSAQAVTYYVSPSGNNSNNGTALGTPFLTIGRATGAANPGDIIEVRAGTYTESLVITRPGNSSNWITLRGYNGEMPVIRRTGAGSTIYFYHSSCEATVTANQSGNTDCTPMYWVVQGLEVRGSATGGGDGNAIKVDTPKVKIIGNKLCCTVADMVKVVRTANDVEIINNEIWQNASITTPGDNAQGVDIVGADRTIVSGNYMHDIPDIGIYAKGNARNPMFENNLMVNIGGSVNGHALMLGQETDLELMLDGNYETYDGTIRNNIVVGSTWACIAISSSYNARAVYNSCYNTGSAVHGSVFLSNESLTAQGSQNVQVTNNIIVANPARPAVSVTTNAMASPLTLTIANNLYWTTTGGAPTFAANSDFAATNFAAWQTNYTALSAKTDNSRVLDPKFRSVVAGYNALTLLGDSPAIDKGTVVTGVTRDFGYVMRTGSYDIGAREFRGTPVTDNLGPSMATQTPLSNAIEVPVSASVSVTFDEALDCGSIGVNGLTVNGVSGTLSCSGSSITLSPLASMAVDTTYTATIAPTVRDIAGNAVRGTRKFQFKTVPSQGAGSDFTFFVYGDSRAGSTCASNTRHMELVSLMAADTSAAMVFHTGDMITGYNGQTNYVQRGLCPNDASRGSFKEIIAPLQNKTPVAGLPAYYFPVIGNHDDGWGSGWYPDPYGDGFCSVFNPSTLGFVNHTTKPYWLDKSGRVSLYTDPQFNTGICSTTSSAVYPSLGYYTFTYKTTKFLILRLNQDTYDLMDCGNCSGQNDNYDHYYYKHQLDWLRYELAAAQANSGVEHVVALVHAPIVTSSWGHGPTASAPILLDEFSKNSKVKLVLSGHNHVYERSYPVLSNSGSPNGYRADANGVYYVVTGGGGSDFHGFNSLGALTEVGTTFYHYIKLTVTSGNITGAVIRNDGVTMDTFTTRPR